jgi:tRNA G37 N-methylase Trm5
VKKAITAAIEALKGEADRLTEAKGKGVVATMDVQKTIFNTRKAEHDRVFKYVNTT